MVALSVLIATRNRAEALRETLHALAGQALDVPWELIVVDNASDDATPAVLADFAQRLPLRVLSEPVPGKSRALNRAIDEARAPLLVFTDDDVSPAPRWLAELHAASRRHPTVGMFAGAVIPRFPADAPDWLVRHLYAGALFTAFVPLLSEDRLPAALAPVGPNCAFRAEALGKTRLDATLGPQPGTDFAMASDVELGLRLRARGVDAWFIPKAVIRHRIAAAQLEEASLLRRGFRWGRGTAWMYAEPRARRVDGAPGYLWLWLAIATARELRARGGSVEQRTNARLRLEFVRGLIAEERALAERPSDERPRPLVPAALARSVRRVYAGLGSRDDFTAAHLAAFSRPGGSP